MYVCQSHMLPVHGVTIQCNEKQRKKTMKKSTQNETYMTAVFSIVLTETGIFLNSPDKLQ